MRWDDEINIECDCECNWALKLYTCLITLLFEVWIWNRLLFRSHRFNLKVHWLCSFVAVNECMAAAAAAAATEYAQSMNERWTNKFFVNILSDMLTDTTTTPSSSLHCTLSLIPLYLINLTNATAKNNRIGNRNQLDKNETWQMEKFVQFENNFYRFISSPSLILALLLAANERWLLLLCLCCVIMGTGISHG